MGFLSKEISLLTDDCVRKTLVMCMKYSQNFISFIFSHKHPHPIQNKNCFILFSLASTADMWTNIANVELLRIDISFDDQKLDLRIKAFKA